MVRSSTYRASKYSAKLVGDVIKNRIDAQKDSMTEQFTTQAGLMVGKEEAVKILLTGWGIVTPLVPFYLAYARELYGITRKHSGSIAENEACLACKKWGDVKRGLTKYYLQVIALDTFSLDVSACT